MVFCCSCDGAASSSVVPFTQRKRLFIARFRHKSARQRVLLPRSTAIASGADVWSDFGTPQQERAKLRAPRGPRVPKFLVKEEEYNYKDFKEIGFVWKAIGVRGEVLVRVCTSLQDYRVGLPGPRCDKAHSDVYD